MAEMPKTTDNLLLNVMDERDRDRLLSKMERIDLHREMTLAARNEPIPALHFMEGGVTSIVATDEKTRTEVGIIGKEGAAGVSALLGEKRSAFEMYVQVGGSTALRIGAAEMCAEMEQSASVRKVMLAYAHCFTVQVSYAVVSNADYMMEARLARWLLMCHDRVPGDQIALTHEFMATMISAQRSGVTIALHSLEGAGMIRSTRGLVTITDRAKLADLAGDSYGKPEEQYRELIGPFGK